MEEELEKLINLTYGRFRDEFEKQIMKEETDSIQQSAAKGISGPAFYSSISDLHLEKIRKLYKKRIEIEKQLMLDKYGHIPNSEIKGLKNRVNKIIEVGIRNLENKRYGGRIEPILLERIKEKGISLQLCAERDIEIEIGYDKLRAEKGEREPVKDGLEGIKEMYIDGSRIKELLNVHNGEFDLSKLIRILEEMNICYSENCYFSIIMLTRALIDHVPPIFGCKTFSEVANNYQGTKSFKASMEHLDESSRNIADQHLHGQIRKSETLPNKAQTNFFNDIDVLLSEIVRILK